MASGNEQNWKEYEQRQKEWNAVVSSAIKAVEDALLKKQPRFRHTIFFGAMGIDPKHLAIWCFFHRDQDLEKAETEGFTTQVTQAMRVALRAYGYPAYLTPSFFVSFATHEDVERTSGGNYRNYLQ